MFETMKAGKGMSEKRVPDENELMDLAELFKVFGDTTRMRILFSLFTKEFAVTELADALNMTQSAVSHQLRILRNAKLIASRRDGKNIFYSLADDHVVQILACGLSHVTE